MTHPSVYRAGIIGCGRIADSIEDELVKAPAWSLLPYSHAGAYQRCPRTHLVAAADLNKERLESFGRRRGVDHLYADYREMLDREGLDIVSICVPTRAHAAVAMDVAQRPIKGMYLEKPIAQSLGDADRMIAAFRSRGIKVAVNHVRTWDPTYGAVRRLVAGGAIGPMHLVVAHFREGALFGGTHVYDLVRSLLGAEPEWVFGELAPGAGTFDPGARGIVGFPGGVRVFLNCSEEPLQFELDLIGTEGRIRVGNGIYPELWQVDLEIAVALHLSHRSGERVRLPVTDPHCVIEDPWGRDR